MQLLKSIFKKLVSKLIFPTLTDISEEYVAPKTSVLTFNGLHSVISQEMELFNAYNILIG
jgi:hypothetical protein